ICHAFGADEIDSAFEAYAIDDNANAITFLDFPDGPARQGLRADMADAGASGNAGKSGVGDKRDVFAVRQMFERGSELIGFLHAGADGPATNQNHDVAGLNLAGFDGEHRFALGSEDASRTFLAIDAVSVND